MQSNTISTQGRGVNVSAKILRDKFYLTEMRKRFPDGVADRFESFRLKTHAEQMRTSTINYLRHLRQTLRTTNEVKKNFKERYFDLMEGKLISIEMECVFDNKDTMPKQKDLGTFMVTMCDDGSIRTDADSEGTAEVKVTISHNSPMRLKKVTDKLNQSGGGVNASCGMHIHLDQRDVSYLTASKRAKRLIKALPALKLLVAPSRLGNNYCNENQPIRGDDTQYRHSSNRYRMVNFLPAYDEHKTIEVRLHGGTLDFWKILGWVNLCQFISDCTEIDRIALENYRTANRSVPFNPYLQITIENLIRIEKMPESLRSYVWKRFRQFHPAKANELREKLSEEGKFHLTDGMAIS